VVGPGECEAEITIPHKLTSSQAHVRLALVTYRGLPNLSTDDQLLLAPLAARGVRAEPAAWDDAAIDWDSYDALVIRSTWNYHKAYAAFVSWIDHVETLGIPTWNPPAILRWNANKTYLRDLATAGVNVVPTRWVAQAGTTSLADLIADAGWSDVVVKPTISASAYETWRVAGRGVSSEDESRFQQLAARGSIMVQPFVPELERDGEWSLFFLRGEYSHAALKRPRAGDFRVQSEHGGTVEYKTAPRHLIAAASTVTAHIPGPWLYARVDGCEVDGQLLLMELELLEPWLGLGAAPRAAERFAEAIARVLGSG
jgi:glutathione synthase/RimK-type ligase-like ATP-grasp enzyme